MKYFYYGEYMQRKVIMQELLSCPCSRLSPYFIFIRLDAFIFSFFLNAFSMAPLKVIGAGYGRTGTDSLRSALDILGYVYNARFIKRLLVFSQLMLLDFAHIICDPCIKTRKAIQRLSLKHNNIPIVQLIGTLCTRTTMRQLTGKMMDNFQIWSVIITMP